MWRNGYLGKKMRINVGFESYAIIESENILAYYFFYLLQILRNIISCDGILLVKLQNVSFLQPRLRTFENWFLIRDSFSHWKPKTCLLDLCSSEGAQKVSNYWKHLFLVLNRKHHRPFLIMSAQNVDMIVWLVGIASLHHCLWHGD